ncbi:serine protease [Haplosporangium sp. Z 767]|nr:serine protease [Haplosporangium sp. Z 767]
MKVVCLLSVPFLLASLVDAAEYLVRFKEGAAATSQPPGVSRIEVSHAGARFKGASSSHPKFDYNSNELSLTLLSLPQAESLALGPQNKGGRHRKSKAQVETLNSLGIDNENEDDKTSPIAARSSVEIKSNGRWFTFDDSEFHVWYGNFTEAEAKLLSGDAGVDLMEKDLEIRFPELEQYNNQTARSLNIKRLEHTYDLVDEHLMAIGLETHGNGHMKPAEEGDGDKVTIPNLQKGSDPHSGDMSKKHNKGKSIHPSKGVMPSINAEDIPGPNNEYMIQPRAPSWRKLPLEADYKYPTAAGQGVDVYVIDTGINIKHVDFEGRAKWGVTTVPGAPNTDDNGHGTFVAGVIGSRTFGVAKKVNLIAVKGLNKEGTSTLSQVLAALDWVVKQNARSSNRKNVVNLSLGAGYSKVLNSAVDTLVQSGMFIVAAAGNGNEVNIGQDACGYSPASAPTAFTVGSTNINDQMSSYSNYGQCVNIYAPGERVRSTWIGPTNREVYTDSGTSFSAPNVAGIAALVMSTERGDRTDGSWSPRNIGNRILQLGTRNVIRNFKGPDNTNLLAFNGVGILVPNTNNGGNNGNTGNSGDNGGNNGGNNGDGGDGGNGGNGGEGGNEPPVPPFNNNTSNPPLESGAPSVSSTSNHGPTLNVVQTLTILVSLGTTLVVFFASL